MKQFIDTSKSKIKQILPIDQTVFLLQFLRHPNDIGSLTPSSKALAEAMTRFVKTNHDAKGKRYLEAGAGTGVFTHAIIEKLQPNDTLDVIEINPKFCETLSEKYKNLPNVTIHACSVLDWKPDYQYDVIVSSLPFNAFQAKFVETILNHYQAISKKDGIISYCEYMALPGIRKIFLPSASRNKLQATLDVTSRFENLHQVHLDKVFANFPPACVHHCKV